MKPKEILHFLTDHIHAEPAMVSDHFARAEHVIDDEPNLDAYSESAGIPTNVGRVALNRWDSEGCYFDHTVDL